jgi:hypothetical protein
MKYYGAITTKLIDKQKILISKFTIFTIVLTWLAIGFLFYRFYMQIDTAQAFYLTINVGYRIGYDAIEKKDSVSIVFSIIFMFFGVFVFSLITSKVYRGNCMHSNFDRKNRILICTTILISWIILGIFLSLNIFHFKWSYVRAFYSTVSYLWSIGDSLGSVPKTSNDFILYILSFYVMIGSLLLTLFYGYVATEIEILVENFIINKAFNIDFNVHEIEFIKNSFLIEKNVLFIESGKIEEESKNLLDINENKINKKNNKNFDNEEDLLILNGVNVKKVILNRIKTFNIPLFYSTVYVFIPFVYLLWISTAVLFYYFNNKKYNLIVALYDSISVGYKIGFSNNLKESTAIILFSIVFVFVGSILFITLNVCFIRFFSFKKPKDRLFSSFFIFFSILSIIFLNCLYFYKCKSWRTLNSIYYSISIMVGYGNIDQFNEQSQAFFVCTLYSLIVCPLFALLLGHLSSELGVLDQVSFIDLTIDKYLDTNDILLLEYINEIVLVDDNFNEAYVFNNSSSSSTNVSNSRRNRSKSFYDKLNQSLINKKMENNDDGNDNGIKEYNILILLRLKDFVNKETIQVFNNRLKTALKI